MMTTTKDDESGVMLGCVDVVDGLIHSKAYILLVGFDLKQKCIGLLTTFF
jgi:hypothetical protein